MCFKYVLKEFVCFILINRDVYEFLRQFYQLFFYTSLIEGP